MGSGDV